MIRSPGDAESIALWIVPEAGTWVGALPPIVTVTASIDCLPLDAVTISSPHFAGVVGPRYMVCCWIAHSGTPARGPPTTICVSPKLETAAVAPQMFTFPAVLPKP